jgi:hypothetical protein
VCLQDDAYERDRGPCLAFDSPGDSVTSRFEERVLVVYVEEFSTWIRTCTTSYPSTPLKDRYDEQDRGE